MRAPQLRVPGAPYAELFAEGCFASRPLIDAGALSKAAAARGLSLPDLHRREILEPLDRAGVLCTVGFLQTNYPPAITWLHPERGLLAWREERHPEPWDTYAWDADGFEVSERYSPWQLLYLDEALTSAEVTLPAAELLRPLGPSDFVALTARQRLHERRQLDEEWQPLVKLLVALQPRFWALRTGWSKTVTKVAGSDIVSVNTADHAVDTFDPWALLHRFELSLEDLALLHLELGEEAVALDPLAGWYRVTSFAPRDSSDRFRGAALRARDLHDACFLLRGLYQVATGRWLPDLDELEGPRSPEGWRTVAGHRRRHLPRANDRPKRSRLDLKAALVRQGRAARTVLVADREGEIDRTLRRLREAGALVDPEDVILWELDGRSSSFEEVNFSSAELLAAIEAAGRRRTPSATLLLTPERLDEEFERQRTDAEREGRPPRGFAEVACQLAGRQQYGSLSVGKKDFALDLAEILKEAVRVAGHLAEAGAERPLLARLWTWIADTKRPVGAFRKARGSRVLRRPRRSLLVGWGLKNSGEPFARLLEEQDVTLVMLDTSREFGSRHPSLKQQKPGEQPTERLVDRYQLGDTCPLEKAIRPMGEFVTHVGNTPLPSVSSSGDAGSPAPGSDRTPD